jgi:hypothetical protein
MVSELDGQDLPRGDIIPVAESAGDAQDLVIANKRGVFQKPPDMNTIGECSGLLKGVGRLKITVCPRGTQNQDSWFGHKTFLSIDCIDFRTIVERCAQTDNSPGQRGEPGLFQSRNGEVDQRSPGKPNLEAITLLNLTDFCQR